MVFDTTLENPRELDYRVNGGLEVALLWFGSTNRILVSVVDEKTGDRFELPAEGANAHDVFYHPFAYAARNGIEYRTAIREPEPEGAPAREVPRRRGEACLAPTCAPSRVSRKVPPRRGGARGFSRHG